MSDSYVFGCESLARAGFVLMGDVDTKPLMRFCCDYPDGGAPEIELCSDPEDTVNNILEMRNRLLAQGNSGQTVQKPALT